MLAEKRQGGGGIEHRLFCEENLVPWAHERLGA
jgi:hypothetical protein